MSTEGLRARITQRAAELGRFKGELRGRIGDMNSILGVDAATPRRQIIITPLHREISRTVQKLRHAKNAKAPKAEITRLETTVTKLQKQLQSQKKKAS